MVVTSGSVSMVIAASPGLLYAMISDVTRMGEWSPECRSCTWTSGSGPAVGATFTGHNEVSGRAWQRDCVVVEAEMGRVFAWQTERPVTWRYSFEVVDGGTLVTEFFDAPFLATPERPEGIPADRGEQNLAAMALTLARLKEAAEAVSGGVVVREKLTVSAIDLGIVCRNGDAMLAFYRDVLGLSHYVTHPMPLGLGGTMHRLRCGQTTLKLSVPATIPEAASAPGPITAATGIRYFTYFVADLDATLARVSAAGAKIGVPRTTARPGVDISLITDPDGNWVEIGQFTN